MEGEDERKAEQQAPSAPRFGSRPNSNENKTGAKLGRWRGRDSGVKLGGVANLCFKLATLQPLLRNLPPPVLFYHKPLRRRVILVLFCFSSVRSECPLQWGFADLQLRDPELSFDGRKHTRDADL